MIKTYILEVIKYIPKNQQDDIKKELESVIYDQLENEQTTIEDILVELGNPKELAEQYLNKKHYLVGPSYIDSYFKTLKTILSITFVIIVIAHVFKVAFTGKLLFEELTSSLFGSFFAIFTYVTIGYHLAERNHRKEKEESWHPNKLDLKKYNRKKISKPGIYVSIVFAVFFMVMINMYPNLIGIHVVDTTTQIPLFNIDQFNRFVPWINFALILSISKDFYRLFCTYYSKNTAIISISTSAISIIIILLVILNRQFLNPLLTEEMAGLNFPDFINLEFFQQMMKGISALIVMIFLLESGFEIKNTINNR